MTQSSARLKVRRSGSGVRLEPLLPALRLLYAAAFFLRLAIAALLAMITWRVSHQRAPRIDAHCISFTTAQRKKQCPLNETCMRRAFGAHARVNRARMTRANALLARMHDAARARNLRNCKSCDEIRISCASRTSARDAPARDKNCRASRDACRARLRCRSRVCAQQNIFCTSLPCARVSKRRNRSKKSEISDK